MLQEKKPPAQNRDLWTWVPFIIRVCYWAPIIIRDHDVRSLFSGVQAPVYRLGDKNLDSKLFCCE